MSGGRSGGAGGSNSNGSGGDGDTFVKRISEMFMKWKVRPDVVLRGRHENKSKGALSAFWQVRLRQQQHTYRRAEKKTQWKINAEIEATTHAQRTERDTMENQRTFGSFVCRTLQ